MTAIPVDTIIPTPNGNRRFGDLKVGDYVFDRCGKPTQVTGVFLQGQLDLYKVILADGRATYCNNEHLWTYYTSKNNFKTVTLREMMNKGIIYEKYDKTWKHTILQCKFKIPTHQYVEFDKGQKLPVNPYVVGVFLGNGCNTLAPLSLSSNDEPTVKECANILGFDYKKQKTGYTWQFYYRGNDPRKTNQKLHPYTKEIFKDLEEELCVYSHLKRIPSIYKYASREDRIALIQGLFDTDGSICNNNRANVTYTSTSLELINDIREVLLSLGYSSSIKFEDTRSRNRICYEIIVLVDNCEKYNFFRLPRKLANIPQNKKRRRYDRVGIREVIYMDKQVEMMSIRIDNDEELFLTNNYIVVHS